MTKSKTFKCSLNQLPEMITHIRKYISSTNCPHEMQSKIELAIEEALVNIISYAYPEGEGEIDIETNSSDPDKITITIIDRGEPFDPVHYLQENPPALGPEEMTIGGYGVFLMIEIFDDIHYVRSDGKNFLTLVHHL